MDLSRIIVPSVFWFHGIMLLYFGVTERKVKLVGLGLGLIAFGCVLVFV